MKPNIFKSRKFWIMISDLVFSTVLYFGAQYFTPAVLADVKFLIGIIQPVILTVIAAIAYEDSAYLASK